MNSNNLLSRVKNILLTPRSEWPVIAAESETMGGLYTRYILFVAAAPAVAGFLKSVLFGTSVPMMGTIRIGVAAGLSTMVMQYIASLVTVYVLALIVNGLAPTFGGQKDAVQALKTTAYAATASWVGGVLILVPWLGWLLALAGGIYAIYLVYVGLPRTMRCPDDKAVPYTVVTVLCAIVLGLVIGSLVARFSDVPKLSDMGDDNTSIEIKTGDASVKIDADGTLAKLDDWSKKMEAVGKKMEQAEKSGDHQAQMQAATEMMGALFSGGDTVAALKPEQLKAFLPETLAGMARGDYSAERNTLMGIQVATAKARYAKGDGDSSIRLEIADMGGTKGLASLASWAIQESEQESDAGYERSYHQNGRMVHEQWNNASERGQYDLIVAERFTVKLEADKVEMAELKKLAESLDLAGLENLKSEGVQAAK